MFGTLTTGMEVIVIIKGKSLSVDDIPELIIKKYCPRIASALTYIINLSFSSGYFPDQLKIQK
jgi:hypothetical protein